MLSEQITSTILVQLRMACHVAPSLCLTSQKQSQASLAGAQGGQSWGPVLVQGGHDGGIVEAWRSTEGNYVFECGLPLIHAAPCSSDHAATRDKVHAHAPWNHYMGILEWALTCLAYSALKAMLSMQNWMGSKGFSTHRFLISPPSSFSMPCFSWVTEVRVYSTSMHANIFPSRVLRMPSARLLAYQVCLVSLCDGYILISQYLIDVSVGRGGQGRSWCHGEPQLIMKVAERIRKLVAKKARKVHRLWRNIFEHTFPHRQLSDLRRSEIPPISTPCRAYRLHEAHLID